MDGDPRTADVEPKDAESTQASVSECTPTTLEFQIEGQGGINEEASKFWPK